MTDPCHGCALIPHSFANLAQIVSFVRSGHLPLEALDRVSTELDRLLQLGRRPLCREPKQ